MTIMHRGRSAFLLLMAGLLTASCGFREQVHGVALREDDVQRLMVGTHSRDDVTSVLGPPSTTSLFSGETWYYVHQRRDTIAFLPTEVIERKVLVIRFDEAGVISHIDELDKADGHNVSIVSRETPTFGSDQDVISQMLGNIGRFNTDSEDTPRR